MFVITLPIASSRAQSSTSQPDKKEPLKVSITSPRSGWSMERILTLTGTVSDPALNRGTVVINGSPKGLLITEGQFEEEMVMSPGENTVQVIVEDGQGQVATDEVVVYSRVPEKDIKIVLTWDTNGTDVDLHVIDPSGEECSYNNKETKTGGHLDQDVTEGYGPETFTLSNAIQGTYEIRAHYYSDNQQPQTIVRVEVILFEGTEKEERLVFSGVIEISDDNIHIATFSIPR
jgi:uncharacterized protein YfaP (DUF2135 family)